MFLVCHKNCVTIVPSPVPHTLRKFKDVRNFSAKAITSSKLVKVAEAPIREQKGPHRNSFPFFFSTWPRIFLNDFLRSPPALGRSTGTQEVNASKWPKSRIRKDGGKETEGLSKGGALERGGLHTMERALSGIVRLGVEFFSPFLHFELLKLR